MHPVTVAMRPYRPVMLLMNYLYEATMVDYSDNSQGGETSDHDDWEDVEPDYGLRYRFGDSTRDDDGICD